MSITETLLVVDDNRTLNDTLVGFFKDQYPSRQIVGATTVAGAIQHLDEHHPRVVILDHYLPDRSGLEFLAEVSERYPKTKVIFLTGCTNQEMIISSICRGAMDYLCKPVDLKKLKEVVEKAFGQAQRAQEHSVPDQHQADNESGARIVGRSPEIIEVIKLIGKLARTTTPVLITGESGTGKELIACALHKFGHHPSGPLITIDCGSLPPSLIEAELFGYERGAFTGATSAKPGLFESAHNGTLFMDEIGTMPLELQSKLLRSLETQSSQRLGSTRKCHWQTKIISATNVGIKELVAEGKFRMDLYFRITGAHIHMPPLRERMEDLPLLVEHFLIKHATQDKRFTITREALMLMEAYHWPGNIRELSHVINRAIALTTGTAIDPDDLPEELYSPQPLSAELEQAPVSETAVLPLKAMNRQYALKVLEICRGIQSKAANLLGIDRRTFNTLVNGKAGHKRAKETTDGEFLRRGIPLLGVSQAQMER